MNQEPTAPISPATGPSCWMGRDLAATGSHIHALTDDDRRVLERLLDTTAGREALSLTAADFPLGPLAARVEAITREVVEGTGFVLLRTGLETLDEEAARRLVWGLGQHMGVPQPQDGAGTLLHDVRDTGANLETQDDVRIYQTNREQTFHNDGADMVALLCRRQAAEGGWSMIVSAHAIFNEILARRPDLAAALTQPFHFDARGQALPGRSWVQSLPIYQRHAGRWFVLYKRPYIELAQRAPEIPRLTEAQSQAMDMLDALCDDPAFHLKFKMAPGDIIVANNFTTLHARAAYEDSDPAPGADTGGAAEKRHMLRLWLGVEGGVALPPAFADTREFGPLFTTTRRRDG